VTTANQELKPRPAATVILIRPAVSKGVEVFMMRRAKGQSFMAGAFVFPGGRLDASDLDPVLIERANGFTADQAREALKETDLDPATAMGLYFAAVRETYEEAGVLLAKTRDGNMIDLADPDLADRFENYRRRLHDRQMTLRDLAEAEDLLFSLDRLIPYAHWITPPVESKRYDTRFFLVKAPANQSPRHDNVELTSSKWFHPVEALEEQRNGRILLMPPTLRTLEELEAMDSVEASFSLAQKSNLDIMLPQVQSIGDMLCLLLPHDPEYSTAPYTLPPRPKDISRLYYVDGRWVTACSQDPPPAAAKQK
jgi:8-oxo-dGTP pyrophosphatase MutT (NUDIX family)